MCPGALVPGDSFLGRVCSHESLAAVSSAARVAISFYVLHVTGDCEHSHETEQRPHRSGMYVCMVYCHGEEVGPGGDVEQLAVTCVPMAVPGSQALGALRRIVGKCYVLVRLQRGSELQ